MVIGILIALYINNWNENRKSEERVKLLFSQVQKELLYNIERTNNAIDRYINFDPLFYSVIKKKATVSDYLNNSNLRRLVTGFDADVKAQDRAFQLLVENEGAFTQEQETLVSQLRELYGLDLITMNAKAGIINDMVRDFRRKLKDEKPWYSDLVGGVGFTESLNNETPEEMISYFLNDPTYLNQVQELNKIGYDDHLRSLLGFRTRSISFYREITGYLSQSPDPMIDNSYDDFSQYIGSYKNEKESDSSYEQNWEAIISKELDNYLLKTYENDSLTGSHVIYPYKKDSYIAVWEANDENFGVLNKFVYDEQTDKIGIILLGDYGPKNKDRPKFLKVD